MGNRVPLFLLSGAPGAGKTVLASHLVKLARSLVVLEMDALLEDGCLLGIPIASPEAAPIWPAYNRLWLRLTAVIRRCGVPVLLLSPLLPPEVEAADTGLRNGPVKWALLDCAPGEQARCLRARGWRRTDIEDAIHDAEQARRAIDTVFRTDVTSPDDVARQVLAWTASCIDGGASGR